MWTSPLILCGAGLRPLWGRNSDVFSRPLQMSASTVESGSGVQADALHRTGLVDAFVVLSWRLSARRVTDSELG
jgi:hypothetical protein